MITRHFTLREMLFNEITKTIDDYLNHSYCYLDKRTFDLLYGFYRFLKENYWTALSERFINKITTYTLEIEILDDEQDNSYLLEDIKDKSCALREFLDIEGEN